MTSKEENDLEDENQRIIIAGDTRSSQIVTTHGPGSIINMKNDAVMIYGCHLWLPDQTKTTKKGKPPKMRYKTLHHEFLEKKITKIVSRKDKRCKVSSLKMPISLEKSINVPCFSFPQWGVCKNCDKLQKHDAIPNDDGNFYCVACSTKKDIKERDKYQLIHARFVVICNKGHIDEFPWKEWVHQRKPDMKCPKDPDKTELFFRNNENSSAQKAYFILCSLCGAYETVSGASEAKKFREMNMECTGKRPWISQRTDTCLDDFGKPTIVKGMPVRASSLWYSIMMSAVKIPRWLHPVHKRLEDERLYGAIELDREKNLSFEKIYDRWEDDFKDVVTKLVEEKKKKNDTNYSEENAKNEIIDVLGEIFTDTESNDDLPGQLQILNQEFEDLDKTTTTKGESYESDFELETVEIEKNDSKSVFRYLDSLKKIHRITSITALIGFTRDVTPDLLDPDENKISKITTNDHLIEKRWLPAFQTKGEGIFLTLNDEKLTALIGNEELEKRCSVMIRNHAENSHPHDKEKQEDIKKRFNSKFILLHTLSHLIIKSLVKEAGYDEPSLRERIYWDGNTNGILIYAAGSSEGSLGGLVRLGNKEYFEKILIKAIEKSKICSRDPVCNDVDLESSKAQEVNGSACHSCCFVAETTCSFFNQFLDRQTISEKNFGFMKDVFDEKEQ